MRRQTQYGTPSSSRSTLRLSHVCFGSGDYAALGQLQVHGPAWNKLHHATSVALVFKHDETGAHSVDVFLFEILSCLRDLDCDEYFVTAVNLSRHES